MKDFSGNALYTAKGAAKEYSEWACNFFTGCSNDCDYCYCKRGVLSHTWDTTPHLKKCFKDEIHAMVVFRKELDKTADRIKESGALLFSFTTDPLLPETRELTVRAMEEALSRGINVKVLTKRADWIDWFVAVQMITSDVIASNIHRIAFGFTLTDHDEMEPDASTNQERIDGMHRLYSLGFRTFASIEPVVDPESAKRMIRATATFCDLYKVGLMSGVANDYYDEYDMAGFLGWLLRHSSHLKIYLKDSLVGYFKSTRAELAGWTVDADYDIFSSRAKIRPNVANPSASVMQILQPLVDEVHNNVMDAHDQDDWQDAAHYILDVMPRTVAETVVRITSYIESLIDINSHK